MTARRLAHLSLLVIWSGLGPVWATGCSLDETTPVPSCSDRGSVLIVAQSVPGAAFVPCIEDPGSGWEATRVHVDEDGTLMRFDLGLDAKATGDVQFAPVCEKAGGTSIPSGIDGVHVHLVVPSGRHYLFDGGCVGIRIDGDAGDAAVDALIDSVVLVQRTRLAAELRRTFVDAEL
jgi:hypothetical protein